MDKVVVCRKCKRPIAFTRYGVWGHAVTFARKGRADWHKAQPQPAGA